MSFKDYLKEQQFEAPIGIHINDDFEPWTDWILDGKKTIETRNKPTLNSYVGQKVGLIKTGKKKQATLIGYATIEEPIKYNSPEEFNKDYDKHRVSADSKFYHDGLKYGYPLTNVKRTTPIAIDNKWIKNRQARFLK